MLFFDWSVKLRLKRSYFVCPSSVALINNVIAGLKYLGDLPRIFPNGQIIPQKKSNARAKKTCYSTFKSSLMQCRFSVIPIPFASCQYMFSDFRPGAFCLDYKARQQSFVMSFDSAFLSFRCVNMTSFLCNAHFRVCFPLPIILLLPVFDTSNITQPFGCEIQLKAFKQEKDGGEVLEVVLLLGRGNR